jgi:hypothetical protein
MNAPLQRGSGMIGALAILDSGKLTLYNGAPNNEADKPS